MSKHTHKAPSQRQLQVGEVIRQALSTHLLRGDLYGPNGETLSITVSQVKVSPDLKNATVFVIPLGGKDPEAMLQSIEASASKLREMVAKELHLRYVPRLSFSFDDTFEQASKINSLLHTLSNEDNT